MKARLVWTPQASEDLIEIYVTIGLDNQSAAERVFTEIESQIELLAIHPRLGVRRPEIATSARLLVYGVYLILYETRPDSEDEVVEEVEIVRIVHGHRDLGRIF